MGKVLNIAVAGAGIGGLALAAFLGRAGHRVRVFDQFETPQPVGSGLMLQQTGLFVLGKLGLRDRVEALGSCIDRLWGLTTPSLRPVLDVRYTAWRKSLYGVGVQRAMLFNTLLGAAEASGAELAPSTMIASADADAGSLITQDGQNLGPFDLVIDSLGVRSPLTRAPKQELPYGALWATLPWPKDSQFDKTALEQRYHHASKMTGVMASGRMKADAPENLTYFWSIRADEEAKWRNSPLEAWKTEAAALWPETQILLAQITSHDQLTFARYRHRTHKNPISGPRLIHMGDAWHAASPQLGQGANMALLDAAAIAKALSETDDVTAAAARYKRLRNTHVQLYQLMTWAFTPVYQGDSRVLPWLRDWLAAPLSRIWPAPQILAAMVSGLVGHPLSRLR